MVIIAAGAVLAGSLPAALGGLDGVVSAGAVSFLLKPRLDGGIRASCDGLSPLKNTCASSVVCPPAPEVCGAPWVVGSLGYTGRITATLRGFDFNRPPLPVFVATMCDYAAGNTRTSAAGATLVGCSTVTDIPYRQVAGQWGYFAQGPFTLEYSATLPTTNTARGVGQWTAEIAS